MGTPANRDHPTTFTTLRAGATLAALLLAGCGGGGGGGGGSPPPAPQLSAALSAIDLSASEGFAADGSDSATIVVTVLDVDGDPVEGIEVQVSAAGGGTTITQPTDPTDAAGEATATITATTVGAKTLTITLDPLGDAVVCDDHPIVRFGPQATLQGVARYFDVDRSATISAGDELVLPFDQDVTTTVTDADAFELPVSGDSFGTGATIADGPGSHEITVTLGAGAVLRSRQGFDAGNVASGAPSGIDVSGTLPTGAIVDVASGQTVLPSTPLDLATGFVPRDFGPSAPELTDTSIADVDGDGDLDLAGRHFTGIDLWLNDGDGTFTASAQSLGTGYCVELGDLDGDGDADLAIGVYGGPSRIALNDGAGGFSDSGQSLGSNDTTANALGDLDGDGDLDLICGNNFAPDEVWFNDGSGLFTLAPTSYDNTSTLALVVGDVDRDGDLDWISTGFHAGAAIWLNDGSGGFTAGPVLGSSEYGRALDLFDWDQDGDPDLATTDYFQPVQLWANDGSGTFTDLGLALGPPKEWHQAWFEDVDSDGDVDLLCGAEEGLFLFEADALGSIAEESVAFETSALWTMAVADFDGDGDVDVVGAAVGSGAHGLSGSFTGTFGPPSWSASTTSFGTGATLALAIGDLDGDGDADFVHGDGAGGSADVWRNDGGGAFTLIGSHGGAPIRDIALGDLDGDGDLDMTLGLDFGLGFNAWYNDGAGGMSYFQNPGITDTSSISLVDVDLDGALDYITSDRAADGWIFLNTGDGSFGVASVLATSSCLEYTFGDVDGDGDPDLVALPTSAGNESIWLNSSGTFAQSVDFEAGTTTCSVLADFDRDGDFDLLFGRDGDGDVLWLNDGSGAFSDSGQVLGAAHTTEVVAIDLDHDGDLDYVASASDGDGLSAWINDGAATFAFAGKFGDGASAAVGAEDFDGDGDEDLLAGRTNPDPIELLSHD
ncbi:MAG: VCBS repeat-containing protein [Planctomycetes bacterium]|nr:VCBS repeat-containing protein [Planctomycetota bacterium]